MKASLTFLDGGGYFTRDARYPTDVLAAVDPSENADGVLEKGLYSSTCNTFGGTLALEARDFLAVVPRFHRMQHTCWFDWVRLALDTFRGPSAGFVGTLSRLVSAIVTPCCLCGLSRCDWESRP